MKLGNLTVDVKWVIHFLSFPFSNYLIIVTKSVDFIDPCHFSNGKRANSNVTYFFSLFNLFFMIRYYLNSLSRRSLVSRVNRWAGDNRWISWCVLDCAFDSFPIKMVWLSVSLKCVSFRYTSGYTWQDWPCPYYQWCVFIKTQLWCNCYILSPLFFCFFENSTRFILTRWKQQTHRNQRRWPLINLRKPTLDN